MEQRGSLPDLEPDARIIWLAPRLCGQDGLTSVLGGLREGEARATEAPTLMVKGGRAVRFHGAPSRHRPPGSRLFTLNLGGERLGFISGLTVRNLRLQVVHSLLEDEQLRDEAPRQAQGREDRGG